MRHGSRLVRGVFASGPRAALFVTLTILLPGGAVPALALTINSPTTFAAADASDGAVNGVFNVNGDLTIANGGSITCSDPAAPVGASACAIRIVVTGNMEVQAGGAILAENIVGGGNGGKIKITVGGNLVLRGPGVGTAGARISSSETTGGGGNAGNIAITVGNAVSSPPTGDFTMEPGAEILANSSSQSGGGIAIRVARTADVDGLVESFGGIGGIGGNQLPGGGPIFIDAGCDLTVSDAGKISSRGGDPGADLVHLEGGCVVSVFGLVESTGLGHITPNRPPNSCSNVLPVAGSVRRNAAVRPGKPTNSTACVEVVAGDSLVIDGKNHNGEINADTGGPGGAAGTSWIYLGARGTIVIVGSTDVPFAVHANGNAGSGDNGGTVKVQSRDADVLASELAIQADAVNPGGRGGAVSIEAHGLINLDTARIFARGDSIAGGGFGIGGTIGIHSFAGNLSWQDGVGDVRPTGQDTIPPIDDNPPPASRGVITFEKCNTGAVVTTGTSFPHNGDAATTPMTIALGVPCAGSPTIPAFIQLPPCLCLAPGQPCIDVTKFCTDATIPGGEIHFNGTVRNCGQEALNNVTAKDDRGTPGKTGDDIIVLPSMSLAPGASAPYSGAYTPSSSPSTDRVTATGTGAATGISVSKTASATCSVAAPGGGQGCTPGYWKQSQHFDSWVPTGFLTTQTAGSVFSNLGAACPTLAGKTLVDSLQGGGGPSFCKKVRILTRAAVAAVLNAAHLGVSYPRTVADIQAAVNTAIASGKANIVTDLASALDKDNNLGCPLN
jgi:hypothetical protein